MTLSRMRWLAALALSVGSALTSHAQTPIATLGRPVATVHPAAISRPVVRASAYTTDVPTPYPHAPIQPVVATIGIPSPSTPAAADLSSPPGSRPVETIPLPPPPPPTRYGPPETVSPAVPGDPGFAPSDVMPGAEIGKPVGPSFWEKCGNLFGGGGGGGAAGGWASDNCLPGLISPVTMPFYAEDPRALTEIRPILMYQSIPGSTPTFGGGSAWYFGTQARLAFTDRFSVVLHELGYMSFNPDNQTGINNGGGLAAIKISPKYTFLKSPETGSIAAVGLMFDLPIGTKNAYQDVGTASIAPYVSYGQTFGRLPGGYGSLNFIGNLGYSLGIDDKRSDFLYSSLHLDWNIANANTFFPLVELNWLHYTSKGSANTFGTEGADLINFGDSTRTASNYVTLAAGMRYKLSDHVILGGAIEGAVGSDKFLNSYRFTFDVIFRY